MFNSISEKIQKNITYFCGIDKPRSIDIYCYGIYIILGSEDITGDLGENVVDNIASITDTIDGILGFLDLPCKRIDMTRWDQLNEWING